MKLHWSRTRSWLRSWDSISRWTAMSIKIASKHHTCMLRTEGNLKDWCGFFSSICAFICLFIFAELPLHVSSSDLVTTRHCLHSWKKLGIKKYLTFSLNVQRALPASSWLWWEETQGWGNKCPQFLSHRCSGPGKYPAVTLLTKAQSDPMPGEK